MIQSRYTSTEGVQCADCGWEGQRCDCRHGYLPAAFIYKDADPCDFCPACGLDNIVPIEEQDDPD